jgi:hypothetical protein
MHSRSTYIAASAAIISGVLLGLAISDQRWGWTSATELEQQLDYNNYGHPSMIYLQGGERGIGVKWSPARSPRLQAHKHTRSAFMPKNADLWAADAGARIVEAIAMVCVNNASVLTVLTLH